MTPTITILLICIIEALLLLYVCGRTIKKIKQEHIEEKDTIQKDMLWQSERYDEMLERNRKLAAACYELEKEKATAIRLKKKYYEFYKNNK